MSSNNPLIIKFSTSKYILADPNSWDEISEKTGVAERIAINGFNR